MSHTSTNAFVWVLPTTTVKLMTALNPAKSTTRDLDDVLDEARHGRQRCGRCHTDCWL